MAVTIRSNGLQHAISLGNIEVSSKANNINSATRCYDSEDENMGRKKHRPQSTFLYPRTSVYSKVDIREQYCLSDRQLNSIERPRREKFFGCLSGRRAPQSFLGVCVGRRAPSDENIADFAPFYKYPRYYQNEINYYDEDIDSSYFRRRPTSILSTGSSNSSSDPKRCTWMPADEDAIRLEGPRSVYSSDYNDYLKGPYVVGSYPSKTYLSQSTEQISGLYRCPAHIGLSPTISHPPMISNDNLTPRTKHVSFARSHTLTSFDEAGLRSSLRLNSSRSQERLIGGRKPYQQQSIGISTHQLPSILSSNTSQQHPHQMLKPAISTDLQCSSTNIRLNEMNSSLQSVNLNVVKSQPEIVVVEKIKRGAMKTQATQTEVYLGRKGLSPHHLSLSPRTIHRVKMVSQGAQTNGGLSGRILTKSFSEMVPASKDKLRNHESSETSAILEHELLHRTYSEEPPRSPSMVSSNYYIDRTRDLIHSRNSSNTSGQPQSSLDAIGFRSRHNSQESAISVHSTDITVSQSSISNLTCPSITKSKDVHISFTHDNYYDSSRPNSSHDILLADSNEINSFGYEYNSLPRRNCTINKTNKYCTFSLLRKEQLQKNEIFRHLTKSSELLANDRSKCYLEETDGTKIIRRSSLMNDVTPKTHKVLRRQSMPGIQPLSNLNIGQQLDETLYVNLVRRKHSEDIDNDEELDESLTDNNDIENKEEHEIIIDFKPHISPIPSPKTSRKKLQKTLSAGEIEKRQELRENMFLVSASEEDLKINQKLLNNKEYQYQNLPIKDEGICDKKNLLAIPIKKNDNILRIKREAFRKRSISLESSSLDDENRHTKSAPPSPGNDDHSDGIWNESQATVLHAESKDYETIQNHLTPSTKRKNLILQHQQRSSVDTDALDMEEQFSDQSMTIITSPVLKLASTQTYLNKPEANGNIGILSEILKPLIAVTPSSNTEICYDEIISTSRRSSRTLSPALYEKKLVEPLIHNQIPQRLPEQQETNTINLDAVIKTNADISECSTNTDEYITCTENSRHTQGIKTSTTASSSSTQIPVSAQNSQTATQTGSSFESASSLYSTKGDGQSDDILQHQIEKIQIRQNSTKISPTRSLSSSSSAGSYNVKDKTRFKIIQNKIQTPIITNINQKFVTDLKKKSQSISDDERSEKHYSSSGYYESPYHEEDYHGNKYRKIRDWNEDDRHKRKLSMKLDIERENLRALTSPIKKPKEISNNQISPDSILQTNKIIDNTIKIKRFRTKLRRQFRNRCTSGDDLIGRKIKSNTIINNKNCENLNQNSIILQTSPSIYQKLNCNIKQRNESMPENRLKAKSIESLRSVSPGSDSVFYSETDIIPDHQVHCHHCGKEVEIVTAMSGSQETIDGIIDDDELDIVKPPADFADSPVITKISQRLYKKMDKRFRSVERHGDPRNFRYRQDNTRAKSEERGKEQFNISPQHKLRPTGSSPCVMPDNRTFIQREQEQDQGIYHGNYHIGEWVCVNNRDIWRPNNDIINFDRPRGIKERKGSTESEEEFRKKYQVITHRLVHRSSCLEMFRRQNSNSFTTDKKIFVSSESGEFGFRIHGSKPVVVSAIEPETPAENCGLEVGDILLSVNGVPVLDKNHSEVVKIAHDGCETLEIEIARTMGVFSDDLQDTRSSALYSGYLWRLGGQVKGTTNPKKWVRRWFVLRPDHCLYYYKSEAEPQPVGAVLLIDHTIEQCCKDIGRQYAFKIESEESSKIYLAAESEEALNRWIAVISHAATQGDTWLEISTRNLRLAPNMVPKPDCFGYLMKLGSRWRGWTKRYCVLKDACLYFYNDANSKNAFGMACLQGYRVQPSSSNAIGKKHAFEISPAETKLRHYFFSTESEIDKKRWIAALEYSIDRWMKAR